MSTRSVSLSKKLFSCILAMFTLLAILSVVTLVSLSSIEERSRRSAEQTTKALVLANRIETAKGEMLAAYRGHYMRVLLKEMDNAKKLSGEFRENAKVTKEAVAEILPLLTSNEGKNLARQLDAETDTWLKKTAEVEAFLAQGKLEEAKEVSHGTSMWGEMRKHSVALEKITLADLEKDKQMTIRQADMNRYVIVGFIVVALGVCVVFGFMVRQIVGTLNRIAKELVEGSEQVASAASQVSSSSQALAQGASEQAASLQETSSSTEEINSMTRSNAGNSRNAAEIVTRAGQDFEAANGKLKELVASMGQINASSDKIAKIIKLIDEIAFQTNILALNAAVEAARAGEAGMGFAVVADEVRNLAHRCAQAAKDTAQLIEESINNCQQGSQKLTAVETAIAELAKGVQQVKTLVDEVSVGSQQQASGLDEVAKSIGQMEQVTEKTAASAEESAAAGEELKSQSATLREIVDRLIALIGLAQAKAGRPQLGA